MKGRVCEEVGGRTWLLQREELRGGRAPPPDDGAGDEHGHGHGGAGGEEPGADQARLRLPCPRIGMGLG